MRVAGFSKIEAAKRQIDAAIRMHFHGYDPIATHTLASAGTRILRDLAEKKGKDFHQSVRAFAESGTQAKYWQRMNSLANYLKHADRDPDSMFDGFEEEFNDGVLFTGALYYQDLGNEFSIEMTAIYSWFLGMHPDFL